MHFFKNETLFTTISRKAVATFAINRSKPLSKCNADNIITPELDSVFHKVFWAFKKVLLRREVTKCEKTWRHTNILTTLTLI